MERPKKPWAYYSTNAQPASTVDYRDVQYPSTPLYPLLCEAGLTPASTLPDYRQRLYAYRLLSLPDQHPAKGIVPISLRIGDGGFQPGELPDNTLVWTQETRPTLYGQWLAWQINIEHSIDPADGVEPVETINPDSHFQGEVIMRCKTESTRVGFKISSWPCYVDRWIQARPEGNTGAAVSWSDKKLDRWKDKSVFVGKKKKRFLMQSSGQFRTP